MLSVIFRSTIKLFFLKVACETQGKNLSFPKKLRITVFLKNELEVVATEL